MSEVAPSSRAVGSTLGWRNGSAASSKDDGRKARGFDSHPEHSLPRGVTAAHLPSQAEGDSLSLFGESMPVWHARIVRLICNQETASSTLAIGSTSAWCNGYSVRIVSGNSSVRVRPPAPFRVGLTVGQKPLKLFVEVQILDPELCLRRLTVWHPPFKRIQLAVRFPPGHRVYWHDGFARAFKTISSWWPWCSRQHDRP